MLLRLFAAGALASLAWCQALEEGKRAFDGGNYAAAAKSFEQARQSSTDCNILFYLGLARYRLKQVDSALISFQEAVQCDPKLIFGYIALGEAYSEKGNDPEALAAYERALTLEPANGAALRGAAVLYRRGRLNDKAAAALEVLVKLEFSDPQVHTDLGAAYFATGNQDGAEAEFEAALRLKPDFALALLGLGNVYLMKSDEARAIVVLQKVVKLAPKSFEPRFLLGSIFNRLGRYQDAVTELQAALRLGGEESEVYYHLARAYGGLDRKEDRRAALAKFAELTRRAKDDKEAARKAAALIEQAKSMVASGDLNSAVAHMEAARELGPSDATILFRLASLHYDLKRYDIARNYAQEAIALAPAEWLYHFLLGVIEKASKHWTQARSSLEIAVRLKPSAADAYNELGEVALREGDPKGAIASFEKAAELDPQQAAYRLNLDAVRRSVGEKP